MTIVFMIGVFIVGYSVENANKKKPPTFDVHSEGIEAFI